MRLLYPIALMATIFLASSQSEIALPQVVYSHDKLKHFLLFGLLATSLYRTPFFWNKPILGPILTVLAVSLFGISDEFHQLFVPNRHFDLLDFSADTLGATTAVLAYKFIPLYRSILELNLAKFLKPRNTQIS